jgi:hypothetical protein
MDGVGDGVLVDGSADGQCDASVIRCRTVLQVHVRVPCSATGAVRVYVLARKYSGNTDSAIGPLLLTQRDVRACSAPQDCGLGN